MNSDYRYEIKFVLDNFKLSEAMKWIFNNTSAYRTYQNRIVNSISRDIKELEDTIKNPLGDYRSTEDTITWIKDRFMDYEFNLLEIESKPMNADKTMSIIQCIYRAIEEDENPSYKKNFHFESSRRNGETLLGIVKAIFSTNPTYFGID